MWIPIVGPLVGGVIGGFVYDFFVRNVLQARGVEPDPEIEEVAETALD
jgi:glycerol uptake facilitator protein